MDQVKFNYLSQVYIHNINIIVKYLSNKLFILRVARDWKN